jgi:hypothetical protein
MSGGVTRVSPTSSLVSAQGAPDAKAAKLKSATGDFESLLIKQLLKEAKIAGADKSNGYGDMAIDALASSIERGGGLGLAKHIEHAIGSQGASPPAPHPVGTPISLAAIPSVGAAVPAVGGAAPSVAGQLKKGR